MSPLAGAKIASRFHCGFAMIRRTADQRRSRSAREKIGIMTLILSFLASAAWASPSDVSDAGRSGSAALVVASD